MFNKIAEICLLMAILSLGFTACYQTVDGGGDNGGGGQPQGQSQPDAQPAGQPGGQPQQPPEKGLRPDDPIVVANPADAFDIAIEGSASKMQWKLNFKGANRIEIYKVEFPNEFKSKTSDGGDNEFLVTKDNNNTTCSNAPTKACQIGIFISRKDPSAGGPRGLTNFTIPLTLGYKDGNRYYETRIAMPKPYISGN